jgi:hypothetical protein
MGASVFGGRAGGVLSSMSEIYLVGKWMERGRAIFLMQKVRLAI